MESKGSKPDRYIPPELQIEVLFRLPVKSLVRFVSVSKTWQFLIKDSTFIRRKINLSHENAADNKRTLVRRLIIQEKEVKDVKLSKHIDNENFCQDYVDLEIPPPLSPQQKRKRYLKRYLSDGEVLCIDFVDHFILWNPSINKTLSVPNYCCEKKMQLFHTHSFGFGMQLFHTCSFGFGFDAKADDYKVIRIGYRLGGRSPQLKRAKVFSLREGYWRDIVGESPQHSFGLHPISLKDFIYWISNEEEDMNSNLASGVGRNWILTFDFSDEKFRKIALPDVFARESANNLQLTVFKGSISLFHNYYNGVIRVDNLCSLWIMKEKDVWTMIWCYGPANVRPLGFRLNGEILLEKGYGDEGTNLHGELFALDLKTYRCRSLGMCGFGFQVDAYVESLALFNY